MRNGLLLACVAISWIASPPLLAQSPENEGKLPPIEVQAQRRSVEKRINAYIGAITLTPPLYADSLARWHQGICPVVVGPSQAQVEQILLRLSRIAAAAGVSVR